MYLDVLIEHAFLGNQTLTYHSSVPVEQGVRVVVPLLERRVYGFVVNCHQHAPQDFEIKDILEVVDKIPIINDELTLLASVMAATTVSPLIRCLQTILPNKLKPRSSAQKAKLEKYVVCVDGWEQVKLTTKQTEFLESMGRDSISLKEARARYSGIGLLIDKGCLNIEVREVRYQEAGVIKKNKVYDLTDDQQAAIDAVGFEMAKTYLLHGVTGSGKTEVYLALAQKALALNQQVLIMVPEIALTPQMIERVSTRFGEDVAIYHSGMNDQEKYEQYVRVQEGHVRLVVGTRSSIFLPFQSLGLIVMDEEHDGSYKQDNTPFYHTRDVAIWRSEYHQCPLVLGSASPSLESYARALKHVYQLIEINERVNKNFPEVMVVDTNKALYNRESSYLTQALIAELTACLAKKQQAVLLLNRRGYMTLLKDKNDNVLQCPNCDVAFNFHKDDGLMHCHVCAQTQKLPYGAKTYGSGVGTQRLEEAVQKLFPAARIMRMDADSTRHKNAHKTFVQQFMNHEVDILIGTQMIAKGLDNENVTLVGIVNADSGLTYTDYRAVETTFQMILQATGRAGRGKHPGKVVIQTANPNHYAIQCALHQKYKHFFQQEMQYRKVASYPPYSFLAAIIISADTEAKSLEKAQAIAALLPRGNVQILGPTGLRRYAKSYRQRILLKGNHLQTIVNMCHFIKDEAPRTNRTGVVVDVNPLTLE